MTPTATNPLVTLLQADVLEGLAPAGADAAGPNAPMKE